MLFRSRFSAPRSRHGPRLELRTALAHGGIAEVSWLAPVDVDVTGFRVELSPDGVAWSTAAVASADAERATFPLAGGARVRVVPVVPELPAAATLPSDTYRVDGDAPVLVVDGFDRIVDGSYGGLHHDFAARIAEAAGGAVTVSHRAIDEDGFDLAGYAVVIWLLGDESVADHTFTATERAAVTAYLDGGGRVLASGSEIAWELADTAAPWLDDAFGATFSLDDSGSYAVTGVGALAALGTVGYGGAGAPYAEDYPDAFVPTLGGEVLLAYATGSAAAVGRPGRGALVGFPLELVDTPGELAALVGALLGYLGGS